MTASFATFDNRLITIANRFAVPLARLSIFIVYFWFGILKLFDVSPANPLVADLLEKTLPFMTFDTFIVLFGILEMVIGVLFLIPGWERLAIGLLVLHMITTFMPLLLLPQVSWYAPFVPTLEGQYILKNVVILALVAMLGGQLKPMEKKL